MVNIRTAVTERERYEDGLLELSELNYVYPITSIQRNSEVFTLNTSIQNQVQVHLPHPLTRQHLVDYSGSSFQDRTVGNYNFDLDSDPNRDEEVKWTPTLKNLNARMLVYATSILRLKDEVEYFTINPYEVHFILRKMMPLYKSIDRNSDWFK